MATYGPYDMRRMFVFIEKLKSFLLLSWSSMRKSVFTGIFFFKCVLSEFQNPDYGGGK